MNLADTRLQLVDARPPVQWSQEQVEQAVRSHQERAGALVALVNERIEAAWSQVRLELNRLAGGQASARVTIMAHHAMRAHQALELQTLMAQLAMGGEKKDTEANLRCQAGLAVISTEALNKAYTAAREEGKASNPVTGLMASLGVGQGIPGAGVGATPPGSGPTHVPVEPPGVVAVGAPLSSNTTSTKNE